MAAENTPHKCNDRIAELEGALKLLMEWQVKNVDKWHNSAYDNASAVLKKGGELTPNATVQAAGGALSVRSPGTTG